MGVARDRRFRLALELSLLVHLLLAILLPQAHAFLAALLPGAAVALPLPAPEDEKLQFELVELPQQREEQPSRRIAPPSDLSRRAHGGEGAPADRPASHGTTPDLRMAPPSAARPAELVPQPAQTAERPSAETTDREEQGTTGLDAVLADSAREVPTAAPVLKGLSALRGGSGLEGAVPDRPGGRVDMGPLSFDTQWYDWGPYAAEMLRRIRYHWRIPEIARLGVAGVTRIHFYIDKNGAVSGLEVQSEAEHPPMTFAARDAILDASPLPPLPADLNSEREGVTITFYYNMRPPERYGDDGGG